MLRLLPFFLGALLVFVPVQAQAQASFDVGVRAGLNSSNLDSDFDTDARQGLNAGVFTTLLMPRVPFDLQLEVLFTQKGGDQDLRLNAGAVLSRDEDGNEATLENDTVIRDEFRASYLEIPLLAKVPLDVAPRVDVHLFAGPAVAIRLSEDVSFSPSEWDINLPLEDEPVTLQRGAQTDQFFNNVDFGAALGGDITFDLGLVKPVLDVRYVYGLASNLSTELGRPSGISNRALSVSLGVAL